MRKHKDFMNEPDYGYIDIESCFDPIFEPPIDFLEECRKRWENRMNPFTGTVERKIGNTWYLLETVCDGNEPLTHKVKRLIFSDKEALCSLHRLKFMLQYHHAHRFCQLTQP